MNRIREVWSGNLEQEMATLRDLVDQYPYIGLKTEFPGIVARPIGNFKNQNEFQYQTMRCNVELLKVIQIGITLSDADGNLPPEHCTWQFNFRFDLDEDMYAPDSIEGLRLANMDFTRHQEFGIVPDQFAELLITSGLVLFDEVTWLCYASQNDMGYLLKVLTAAPLPPLEADFRDLLAIWFPRLYDIKYIMKATRPIKVGLQELADEFQVPRPGASQQAGADSYMVSGVFFKIRQAFFSGVDPDDTKFNGQIYGIAGDVGFQPSVVTSPTTALNHSSASLHAQYTQAMVYGMYR